jgi:hypothetical protein
MLITCRAWGAIISMSDVFVPGMIICSGVLNALWVQAHLDGDEDLELLEGCTHVMLDGLVPGETNGPPTDSESGAGHLLGLIVCTSLGVETLSKQTQLPPLSVAQYW